MPLIKALSCPSMRVPEMVIRPTSRFTRAQVALVASLALASGLIDIANAAPSPRRAAPLPRPLAVKPDGSTMDARMFYEVLVGELQARGNPSAAYQIYMELARRHRHSDLFKRAVEIALEARAGNDALAAARAWRLSVPQSRDAAEYVAQILLALGKANELTEPLRALIQLSPSPQQPQLVAALPRTLARLPDRQLAAQVIEEVTQPWRDKPPGLPEAWVATGEAWLGAKDYTKALDATRKAQAIQPESLGAGLLALNLMDHAPQAESLVRQALQHPKAAPLLRLAYARKLAALQRMGDAASQLDAMLQAQPDNPSAWLTLAAVRLELKQPDEAEQALKRYIALQEQLRDKAKATSEEDKPKVPSDVVHAQLDPGDNLEQAYLLMSQVEDQRADIPKALAWLERIVKSRETLLVQASRARLLARQGNFDEARAAIRSAKESEPRDALAKYLSESQLLRDHQQWEEAYRVLGDAIARYPNEPDLLYDRAMLAERLRKYDEMEKLLRKAIEIKPDISHAYNALGYSFADRGIRLDEARSLLEKALSLKPGDPFITDSLGWLEFRSGRIEQALKLLRQAYQARPDAEIAAHLGEVLWSQGEKDEAIRVWRRGMTSDAKNDVLKETIKRLQVKL